MVLSGLVGRCCVRWTIHLACLHHFAATSATIRLIVLANVAPRLRSNTASPSRLAVMVLLVVMGSDRRPRRIVGGHHRGLWSLLVLRNSCGHLLLLL